MKNLILLIALLACGHAQACDPVVISAEGEFEPQPSGFVQKRGRDGRIARLPAPEVEVTRIVRAYSGEMPCEDAGVLGIDIRWPETSVYRLDEVGFYFRVVGGVEPDQIFPLQPIRARWHENGRTHFSFVWMDGATYTNALDLEVEVFAVNRGLELGAPRRFKVHAPGR